MLLHRTTASTCVLQWRYHNQHCSLHRDMFASFTSSLFRQKGINKNYKNNYLYLSLKNKVLATIYINLLDLLEALHPTSREKEWRTSPLAIAPPHHTNREGDTLQRNVYKQLLQICPRRHSTGTSINFYKILRLFCRESLIFSRFAAWYCYKPKD